MGRWESLTRGHGGTEARGTGTGASKESLTQRAAEKRREEEGQRQSLTRKHGEREPQISQIAAD